MLTTKSTERVPCNERKKDAAAAILECGGKKAICGWETRSYGQGVSVIVAVHSEDEPEAIRAVLQDMTKFLRLIRNSSASNKPRVGLILKLVHTAKRRDEWRQREEKSAS
eukprot:g28438.t1